jgi:hypothetical protein
MAEVSVQVLENALPSSLKLTGSEKLGQVILEKGIQISDQIQPQLTNIQNELNSAPNGTCLPPAQLDLIILQRNNIVNKLNQIGSVLDTTTAAAGITSDLLNSLITAAQTLRVAKTALIAADATAGGIGPFASLVFQANEVLDALKFDSLGNSKLNKLKSIIDNTAAPISLTSSFISIAIVSLNSIDNILKQCSPNSTYLAISNDLENITLRQNIAENTLNQITYKGFVLEIEIVPYTPTVNRRRAIGKNQSGIIMIQTEFSFTTSNQVLINELKLIIDRDNLKAY